MTWLQGERQGLAEAAMGETVSLPGPREQMQLIWLGVPDMPENATSDTKWMRKAPRGRYSSSYLEVARSGFAFCAFFSGFASFRYLLRDSGNCAGWPTGSRYLSPSMLVTQHSAKNRLCADCDHPNRSEDCLSLGL